MTPANQPDRVVAEPLFGITLLDGPGLAGRVLATFQPNKSPQHSMPVVNDLRARWRG